jgi:hypothetical protein
VRLLIWNGICWASSLREALAQPQDGGHQAAIPISLTSHLLTDFGLMEEHGLRLFENRLLKRIFGHKGMKVTRA